MCEKTLQRQRWSFTLLLLLGEAENSSPGFELCFHLGVPAVHSFLPEVVKKEPLGWELPVSPSPGGLEKA